MIKSNKTVRLKLMYPIYGIFVADSSTATSGIHPDEFDGAVLSQQFLKLTFFDHSLFFFDCKVFGTR